MSDVLRPPPEVIASWPPPNYIDPETQGAGLFNASIILATLGVLIVSARLYSRFMITKIPGVDDALAVVALIFALALTVLVAIANKQFFSGRHIWDIPPGTASDHRLNVWVSEWCFIVATSAIKISVLLFYRRLSGPFTSKFLWATYAGVAYNVGYVIAFSISLLTICTPVQAYWLAFDRSWAREHFNDFRCHSQAVSLPLAGVFSVIGDAYAAILPSLLMTNLRMPLKQKLPLFALFGMGYLVVGAGVARTYFLYKLTQDFDFTWTLWTMWIWSLVEVWVAVLAASGPALRPFFDKFLVTPVTGAIDTVSKDRFKFPAYYAKQQEEVQRGRGWAVISSPTNLKSDASTGKLGFGTVVSDVESFGMQNNDGFQRADLESRAESHLTPKMTWQETVQRLSNAQRRSGGSDSPSNMSFHPLRMNSSGSATALTPRVPFRGRSPPRYVSDPGSSNALPPTDFTYFERPTRVSPLAENQWMKKKASASVSDQAIGIARSFSPRPQTATYVERSSSWLVDDQHTPRTRSPATESHGAEGLSTGPGPHTVRSVKFPRR